MAVSSGKLKGMIVTVIMLVVLFTVGATVLPLLTGAYYDLSTGYNATQIGTPASNFATNSVDYVGWFIVLGPFLLIIGAGMAIWKLRGRK